MKRSQPKTERLDHLREELTMRTRLMAVGIGITALCLVPAMASAATSQGSRFCTWGGTPTAPTGVITLSPGVTNTPSTGPIDFTATGDLGGGAGCTGKLTFTGYIDPGETCGVSMPFHARAMGLPPIRRAEAMTGVAGTQPVLLYDGDGNVVGSEQAQFLSGAATAESFPPFMDCSTPEGLTRAIWSDTIELFADQK
jgi:hypothetical protein